MADTFKRVVEQVFHNWTALNLAVEYSDSPYKTKEMVGEFISYMVQYCLYSSDVDPTSIEEVLDDIMDQEFETLCEDNSTKEVATVLYRFMNIIKQEDNAKFEEEFLKLPVNTSCSFRARKRSSDSLSSTNDSSETGEVGNCPGVPMELDSEWMVVKSRKRR